MNSDIILKAEDLHFSYDDDHSHSLNGLSLEIRRGQKVAFMGANGSGKSTFFSVVQATHRPQSGKLYFNGEEVQYNRKGLLNLRSKVGIVFVGSGQPAFFCQCVSGNLLRDSESGRFRRAGQKKGGGSH